MEPTGMVAMTAAVGDAAALGVSGAAVLFATPVNWVDDVNGSAVVDYPISAAVAIIPSTVFRELFVGASALAVAASGALTEVTVAATTAAAETGDGECDGAGLDDERLTVVGTLDRFSEEDGKGVTPRAGDAVATVAATAFVRLLGWASLIADVIGA